MPPHAGKWPDVRDAGWQCCRAPAGSWEQGWHQGWEPGTAPSSCPCATQTPAPDMGTAKPSRWRGIKMCCAYDADLSVCSRKRNEYAEVAGKGVGPATVHIHLCTKQYL